MSPFLIGLIGWFLIIGYGIMIYNAMIRLRNNREQAFADIDTQLKMRFDLVGNLSETVKGFATHEKGIIDSITNSRQHYFSAKTADQKMEANTELTVAIRSLLAFSENYPDIKANANFLQLQTELSDIENKIAASRRFFNAATNEFNTYIEQFPALFVARMFALSRLKLFEVENRSDLETAPKIQF